MEMFELDGKVIVPFPRQLRVDKRLSHSLLISWLAPRLSGEEHVQEYRIDVNHQLKTIVDGEKSSAVVENVHEAGTYRISVSAVLAESLRSDRLENEFYFFFHLFVTGFLLVLFRLTLLQT